MDRTWRTILLLWLTGVLAAAQLAKLSALAPLLRARFGLGLPDVSLLVSLIEVGGALFGFVAGLALARIDSRRALACGLTVLILATIAEAFASSTRILFIARAVEGIGYLPVVIAAPTMIVNVARDGATCTNALALWSTFVPVGIAFGSGLTGLAATTLGLRPALLLWAVIAAASLVGVARLERMPGMRRRIAVPHVAAWLLTAGFGCYTLFLCALTALLPSFLVAQHGASLGTASLIAGGASLAALPGTAIALRTTRAGAASPRRILVVAGSVLALGAVLAPLIYRLGNLASIGWLAALVVVLSGTARTLLFTRLPVLTGAHGAGDPRVAAANGLLTQFGAAGALVGPPAGALAVDHFSWNGLGLFISLFMLALLAFLVAAERCGARQRRA